MKYFLSVMITFAVLLGTANIKTKNKKLGQNLFQKRLERLGKGFMTIPLPNGKTINLGLTKDAIAEESACDSVAEEIGSSTPQYTAGALSYFNGVLYYLNNINAAEVENVFCHFVNTMGMDGSIGENTAEIEDEEGTIYVKVTITEPSETFATENGYSKKAVVALSEDGTTYNTTYMTMWWGFDGETEDTTKTKGYLIEGSPKTLGGTRAGYMQWDLTGVNQVGRFIASDFQSADQADPSTINPATYWLSSGGVTTDRAMYGRFKLNTDTNVVFIQGVSIEAERKQGGPAEEYGCFKILGTGVKGGMMVIAKTRDDHSSDDTTYSSLPYGFAQRGHFATGTSDALSQQKTIENLDAACMQDLTDTPNLVGNMNDPGGSVTDWQTNLITAINVSASNSIDDTTAIFDLSCAELAAMNGTGKAFDTANGVTWVDFSNTPEDVFDTTLSASDDSDISAPTRTEVCTNVNETTNVSADTKCYCPSES